MSVKIESVHAHVQEELTAAESNRRRNPLYRHPDKHLLTAASGALFNPRLEAVLGSEEVERVLGTMESGDLKPCASTSMLWAARLSGLRT